MDIWPWVDFALFACTPFVIILVGNVTILVLLWKAKTRRDKMSFSKTPPTNSERRGSTSTSRSKNKMASLTAMLVSRNIAFLVLTLPITVYSIGIPEWQKTNDMSFHEKLYLTHTICILLCYTSNATNLFLYCASGPQFRLALKEALTCKSLSKWASTYSNSSATNKHQASIDKDIMKKGLQSVPSISVTSVATSITSLGSVNSDNYDTHLWSFVTGFIAMDQTWHFLYICRMPPP